MDFSSENCQGTIKLVWYPKGEVKQVPAAKVMTCARALILFCWQLRSLTSQVLRAMVANMGPMMASDISVGPAAACCSQPAEANNQSRMSRLYGGRIVHEHGQEGTEKIDSSPHSKKAIRHGTFGQLFGGKPAIWVSPVHVAGKHLGKQQPQPSVIGWFKTLDFMSS